MRIKDEIFCFAHLRWCHNGWAPNILIVHHSKYWMPIHYDTIEDGQNKKSHLLFSKCKIYICNSGHLDLLLFEDYSIASHSRWKNTTRPDEASRMSFDTVAIKNGKSRWPELYYEFVILITLSLQGKYPTLSGNYFNPRLTKGGGLS